MARIVPFANLATASALLVAAAFANSEARSQTTAHPQQPAAGETGAQQAPPASLVGRILYDGPPPDRKPLNPMFSTLVRLPGGGVRQVDEPDQRAAALGLKDESLIVGNDGGIANVVLWLSSKQPPRAAPGRRLPPVKIMAVPGRFEPHVVAFWNVRGIEWVNAMDEATNFNWSPIGEAGMNPLLQPRARVVHRTSRAQGVPIPLSSNAHPWMRAYLLPLAHPYCAVTDEEGRFEIPNLPPGTWDFAMWHERSGWLASDRFPTGRFKLTIEAGANALGDVRIAPQTFEGKARRAPAAPARRPAATDVSRIPAAPRASLVAVEANLATAGPRPAPTASLVGRVLFAGAPPEPKPLVTAIGPPENRPRIGQAGAPDVGRSAELDLQDESLIVGPGGGIANVLVWLRTYGASPVGPPKPLPAVRIVAAPGRFEPHVRAFWIVRHLEWVNGLEDEPANFTWQPLRGMPWSVTLNPRERQQIVVREGESLPVKLTSQAQPWMNAYILPLEHPYFAVTEEDGRFEIPNFPVGVWDFAMWHERAGRLPSDRFPTGRFQLTIEAGRNELGDVRIAPQTLVAGDNAQARNRQQGTVADVAPRAGQGHP